MDGESFLAVFGLRLPPKDTMLAALATGAQSSAAWVVYGLLALCWIFLFGRAQRLAGFSTALEALPELQRAQILKQAYASFARRGLSSQEYLRSRRRNAWLAAFAALVSAAAVVAAAVVRSLP